MTTKPRETLRLAIEAHSRAIENVTKAEKNLERANALYASLQAQKAEHESLAHDMAVARANDVKLALANGEHPRFDEPPEGFAAKRIARDAVIEQMTGLEETLAVLESELDDARHEAAQLSIKREEAAELVFAEIMSERAAQFEKTILEARRLSYQLRAGCVAQVARVPTQPVVNRGGPSPPSVSGYYNAPSRPVAVPQSVKVAAMEDILGNHELHHGFSLRNETTAQVAAFWQTLKFDHLAQLDGASNRASTHDFTAPPTQPED